MCNFASALWRLGQGAELVPLSRIGPPRRPGLLARTGGLPLRSSIGFRPIALGTDELHIDVEFSKRNLDVDLGDAHHHILGHDVPA